MNNFIEFDNIKSWCYQLLIIGCVGVQWAIKVGLEAYTVHKIHMPILRIVNRVQLLASGVLQGIVYYLPYLGLS